MKQKIGGTFFEKEFPPNPFQKTSIEDRLEFLFFELIEIIGIFVFIVDGDGVFVVEDSVEGRTEDTER